MAEASKGWPSKRKLVTLIGLSLAGAAVVAGATWWLSGDVILAALAGLLVLIVSSVWSLADPYGIYARSSEFIRFCIFDLVLAATCGFLAWWTAGGKSHASADPSHPAEFGLLIALFIGILVLLGGLFLEALRTRLELLEALGVPKSLAAKKSAWKSTFDLIGAYDKVDALSDKMFRDEAGRLIKQSQEQMAALASGDITYPPEEAYRIGTLLVESSKTSFHATILAPFAPHFWEHRDARAYLASNIAAVARGVSVVRYYITDPGDGLSREVLAHIHEQRKAGIKVRLVTIPEGSRGKFGGSALADEKHGCFLNLEQGSRTKPAEFVLTRSEAKLRELRKWINELERVAVDPDPVPSTT